MPNIERAGCRIVTIRNGIDTSRLANGLTDKPLRDRLGIGDDVRLLGFLGRFMEQKGFLPLLDVLQRLRTKGATASFRLLAVGSGDFEREYRAEVARRGLADIVTFFGYVSDIGPILRQLDLLLVPGGNVVCFLHRLRD